MYLCYPLVFTFFFFLHKYAIVTTVCHLGQCMQSPILTQVIMEKKEKAIAARAASAPWLSGSSSVVRDH